MNKQKDKLILIGLVILALLLCVVNLVIGKVNISASDVFNILFGGEVDNESWSFIVENRFNRSLVALSAGGGLAVAGLLLQVFFRNPLAGPGVLGITSGASLGVALIILGGITIEGLAGGLGLITAGIVGASCVLFLLLFISRFVKNQITLLVVGLMLGYFVSALLNVLFLFADQSETRAYVIWGLGSFSGLKTLEMYLFIVVILSSSLIAVLMSKGLNGLALGQEYAKSLGINLKSLRIGVIAITSIIAALVTVFCGPISFIGIAVPQLIRLIVQSKNHSFLIPMCFIGGAVLGISSDLLVRLSSNSLPLNTVTAIIGAPIIIWTIIKLNKQFAKI